MIAMRFRGIGVYGTRPGEIEQPGDFGYRLDQPQTLHPEGRIQIAYHCAKYGVCLHSISRHVIPGVWLWDGNVEKPTITPALDCKSAMRCGQSTVIRNGELFQ